MRDRREGGGQHLLFRPADHLAKATVDREETACGHVDLGYTHRRLLYQGAEPFLTLPERMSRLFEVGIQPRIGDRPGNLLTDPLSQAEILRTVFIRFL